MNLDIVKRDIHKYLNDDGWKCKFDNFWENDSKLELTVDELFNYRENKKKKHYAEISKEWAHYRQKYDKYFLEYIGPILRKYKIEEISIEGDVYKSNKWTFNTIKNIRIK